MVGLVGRGGLLFVVAAVAEDVQDAGAAHLLVVGLGILGLDQRLLEHVVVDDDPDLGQAGEVDFAGRLTAAVDVVLLEHHAQHVPQPAEAQAVLQEDQVDLQGPADVEEMTADRVRQGAVVQGRDHLQDLGVLAGHLVPSQRRHEPVLRGHPVARAGPRRPGGRPAKDRFQRAHEDPPPLDFVAPGDAGQQSRVVQLRCGDRERRLLLGRLGRRVFGSGNVNTHVRAPRAGRREPDSPPPAL